MDCAMVQRLYWLIDGVLLGCSLPGGANRQRGATAADTALLAQDLEQLCALGVNAMLTLTEEPLDEVALARVGITGLHLPVPDLHAPTPDQFLCALDFIDMHRAAGRTIAVHCLMGQGRTGTILAAYLIRDGASARDAIARIRAICDGAIGTAEQEHALERFAARKDWFI
jgi:atypical dual specificity phosphatase